MRATAGKSGSMRVVTTNTSKTHKARYPLIEAVGDDAETGGEMKIQGLITPADWDEKGNVTAISIATFDEDDYLVLKDPISEPMMSLLHEEVEVHGTVTKLEGRDQIKVKSFRLAGSPG